MGGCTISAIRDTREEVLEDIKAKIIEAANAGLGPDSELVVLQNEAKAAELYTVEIVYGTWAEEHLAHDWKLTPVKIGRAFHVGVAARFNRGMKPGEWIATIHVHT